MEYSEFVKNVQQRIIELTDEYRSPVLLFLPTKVYDDIRSGANGLLPLPLPPGVRNSHHERMLGLVVIHGDWIAKWHIVCGDEITDVRPPTMLNTLYTNWRTKLEGYWVDGDEG